MNDDPVTFLMKAILTWWLSSIDNFFLGIVIVCTFALFLYAVLNAERGAKEKPKHKPKHKHAPKDDDFDEKLVREFIKQYRKKHRRA